MNSLQTQLRIKTPPVAAFPWKFGNQFKNNQAWRKALYHATNDVIDTVAGAWSDKSIDFQAAARSIQIIGSIVNTINTNLPQAEQYVFQNKCMQNTPIAYLIWGF